MSAPSLYHRSQTTRRRTLRWLAGKAFKLLCDLRIEGEEHLPESGPLIVVSNHFHFGDPAAVIHFAPWPIEFIGDSSTPNAPLFLSWIRKLWGFILIQRGGQSWDGLMAAARLVRGGGVLFVAPEAGSWAQVLRPARPGAAFLAVQTEAPILPVALIGMEEIFPALRRGRRAEVIIRVGQPFGPLTVSGRGREKREQLDALGHQIMGRIAELLPAEKRGYYSEDPAIREAALPSAAYPWASGRES